jgi:predicted alpha/beta-fold hydrolase
MYDSPIFETNPALRLIATEHGGHLKFLPRSWVDQVVLDWLEELLETNIVASAREAVAA